MPTRTKQIAVAAPDDTPPNAVAGRRRSGVDPIPFPTEAAAPLTAWVIFSGAQEVAEEVEDEQNRASRAHEHHLELIARTDGWKRIGAHEHPHLDSEPED